MNSRWAIYRAVAATFGMLLVLVLSAQGQSKTAPLVSPWDGKHIAPSDLPYACPGIPNLPSDFTTNRYYSDPKSSIIDPVLKKKYDDSVAPVRNYSTQLTVAADAYQTTGNLSAAKCVLSSLHSMAGREVFAGKMGSSQAVYVQGWNLSSWAVPYLKVRGSGVAGADDLNEISVWLLKIAEENRVYYEAKRSNPAPSDAHNNHLYWAAFAYAGAAVAANDRKMFDWCMDAYREGVRDIAADGTLPMELARGQMALHYHLYALSPLVMVAAFGEANGVDLYAASDYAIKRLVASCVDGLASPAFFQEKTGVAQVTTPTIESWEISWVQPYLRRFPDPKLAALLAQCPNLSSLPLGGLPPP
ncbi:MAG: alginate lyase family protein [Candidatus Acidiferrales bacterium]